MVEFNGNLSNVCKNYAIKRTKLISFFALCITCFIFLIPFAILSLHNSLYLIAVFTLIIIPFVSFLPLPTKSLNYIIPSTIIINNNFVISKGKSFKHQRNFDDVKKVIDYGSWYHIIFHYSKRCETFICEKKLIQHGTIDEFEKMFKNKLIRK